MSGKYDVLACGTAGVWRALVEIHARISTKRRRQFHFVMGLMVLGALLELATIGAVVPFVALLADPLRLSRFPEAQLVFGAIGAVTIREQLLATTGVFVALVLLAGVVRLQLSWSCRKFIFQTGHDIALDMLHRILLQPYSFHVARNTSNLIAALDKAGVLAFNVLLQLMQAAIAVTASVFIIAALVYVDPFAALLAAAAIAGCGSEAHDLFLVQRAGSVPGARLALRVTDDGRASCNGSPLVDITSDQLIDARELQRDLKDAAERHLELAPRKGSIMRYEVRTPDGSVRFADNSPGARGALARLTLFVRTVAKQRCHLAR